MPLIVLIKEWKEQKNNWKKWNQHIFVIESWCSWTFETHDYASRNICDSKNTAFDISEIFWVKEHFFVKEVLMRVKNLQSFSS